MRKLIFFILLLAILGGAGYGVYYLVTDKNNDSVENTISIEVSTSLSSTVPTYDGIEVSYEGEVKLGETIIVKAEITDERCAFSHWELNGVFYSDTLETTILLDKYGLKNFVAVVSVGVDVDVNNTIPEGLLANALTTEIIGNKKLGEQITLVATISSDALEKYDFDGWYIDSERISPLETYTLTLDTVEDKNFEARLKYTFVQLSFVAPQIPESDYTVNTTTDIIKSIQGTRKIGQTVTLSAKVSTAAYNNGYEFDYFTINGVKVNSTLNNGNYIYSLTLNNQNDRNIKVFLKFIPENVTVNLEKNHADGVTVSKEGWAVAGRTITLSAVAEQGYVFNYWTDSSGNILSRSNVVQLVLTTPTTLTCKAWVTAPGQLLPVSSLTTVGQVSTDVDYLSWFAPSNKGDKTVTYDIFFRAENSPVESLVEGLTITGGIQNNILANISNRVYDSIFTGTYRIIAKASGMTSSLSEYIFIDAKELVGSKYFSGGIGTEESPYLISNVLELENINRYSTFGKYFKLISNIEFSSSLNNFKGHIDGDGKTISLSGSNRKLGLFNIIGDNYQTNFNTIKNLTIDLKSSITFVYTVPYWSGGTLARSAYKTNFINCNIISSVMTTYNLIKITRDGLLAPTALGGMIGAIYDSNLTECTNKIVISISSTSQSDNYYIGGLVGYASGTAEDELYNSFNGCKNYGPISLFGTSASALSYVDNVGGIVGYACKYSFINCENLNSTNPNSDHFITYNSNLTNVGGIVGYAKQIQIDSCINKATYNIPFLVANINTKIENLGGVIGYLEGETTIYNCENSGIITKNNTKTIENVGGIIGYSYDNIYFYKCVNKADLTACNPLNNIGSLIGECRTSSLGIESCTNSGNISGGYTSDTSGNKWYGKKGA